MEHTFTGVFEQVNGWYMAWVEELPGANTQGKTLDEARDNLVEAIQLILQSNRDLAERGLLGRNVIREQVHVTV